MAKTWEEWKKKNVKPPKKKEPGVRSAAKLRLARNKIGYTVKRKRKMHKGESETWLTTTREPPKTHSPFDEYVGRGAHVGAAKRALRKKAAPKKSAPKKRVKAKKKP